jgi:large subunit ribosomal protein L21
MAYAVVRTGGKQYTVREGDQLKVEKLPGAPGDTVELTEVLMVTDGGAVTVGRPTIPGAKVVAEIVEQGKHKKIHVFKYKAKVRYSKRTGHRQQYTQLAIKQIVV